MVKSGVAATYPGVKILTTMTYQISKELILELENEILGTQKSKVSWFDKVKRELINPPKLVSKGFGIVITCPPGKL